MTRSITTWYTDADDVERDITVEVCAGDLGDTPFTGLPGMPENAEAALRERVAERFWAAEREAYELKAEASEWNERDALTRLP